MTAGAPRVSVVCPVRNGAPWLQGMFDSLCAQTLQDFELLVVDDASEDATPDILRAQAAKDGRIRTLRNPQRLGAAASRNRAIRMARGAYLTFQDADDFSLPERLESQVRWLDGHPDVCALGTGGWALLRDRRGRHRLWPMSPPTHPAAVAATVLYCTLVIGASLMVRREIFAAVGLLSEKLPHAEDLEFTARLTGAGRKVATIRRRFYVYRKYSSTDNALRDRRNAYGIHLDALERLLGRRPPDYLPAALRAAHSLSPCRDAQPDWPTVRRVLRQAGRAMAERYPDNRRRLAWLFRSLELKTRAVEHLPAALLLPLRLARLLGHYAQGVPARLRLRAGSFGSPQ